MGPLPLKKLEVGREMPFAHKAILLSASSTGHAGSIWVLPNASCTVVKSIQNKDAQTASSVSAVCSETKVRAKVVKLTLEADRVHSLDC